MTQAQISALPKSIHDSAALLKQLPKEDRLTVNGVVIGLIMARTSPLSAAQPPTITS